MGRRMSLTHRRDISEDYRYGFQGQEKDNEVYNVEGGAMNYKYRMHDTRLGRFFAVDPLEADYPHNSPYAFSENQVIDAIELEGLEKWEIHQQEISQVIYPGTSNYEFTSNIVETTITEQSGTLYGPYLNQEIVDDVFLSDKSKVENYQSENYNIRHET